MKIMEGFNYQKLAFYIDHVGKCKYNVLIDDLFTLAHLP